MPQAHDLKVFVHLEGEAILLKQSTTIGRQLDNDLMVAGEDVLDFHLRLEPTARGARAFPLGEASLIINGEDWAEPVDLVSGDCIRVGQTEMQITAELAGTPQADEWWLYADGEESVYRITGQLNVGRGDESEILLLDDHISRRHACLKLVDGLVWLKDLRSANGTFVNGERLTGGCRLYHGDEVSFDTLNFQLIGRGRDLTPVRRHESATDVALIREPASSSVDTTEFSIVDPDNEMPLVVPDSSETGAFLLGVSDPIAGRTFRTGIGTTTVGRDTQCDVMIPDSTVSARHAEIVVRPEATTITNLMATNGTRVNGTQIQNAQLADGDLLRIGQVSLVFKDVPASDAPQGSQNRFRWGAFGALVVLMVLVLWLIG